MPMQCSRMQSDATLSNPVSVVAEVWRVMQHNVICQCCRELSSMTGDDGGSGGGGVVVLLFWRR